MNQNKYGTKKEKLNKPKEYFEDLYIKHKTLSNVAKVLDVSLEMVRRKFIDLCVDYKRRELYSCNHNFFSTDTEESMYWAGFFAADGSISIDQSNHKDNRIAIWLKSTDETHLIKFLYDVKSNTPIKHRTQIDNRPGFKTGIYHSSGFRISSPQMKRDLGERFGILPKKSKTFIIPNRILESNLFEHYLRGMWDGDGSIFSKDLSMHICGNKLAMDQITDKLTKIKVFIHCKKREDGLGICTLNKNKEVKMLLEYLYNNATVYLERKFNEAQAIYNTEVKEKIEINKDLLLNYLESGMTPYTIAKTIGVSLSTIKRRIYEFYGEIVFKKYFIKTNLELNGYSEKVYKQ